MEAAQMGAGASAANDSAPAADSSTSSTSSSGGANGNDHGIETVGFDLPGEVDELAVNKWLVGLLQDRGPDLYRMKGVLAVKVRVLMQL